MSTMQPPQDEIAGAKEMPATLVANANALLAQFDAMSRALAETNRLLDNFPGSRLERRAAKSPPRNGNAPRGPASPSSP